MNIKISYPFIIFVTLIVCCFLTVEIVDADSIVSSNLCDPNVKQYSGYLTVDTENFFFWFFESRNNPSTSPLTLWLAGGPGCSSMVGLLLELGPCQALPGGQDVTNRAESWNGVSNMLFVDQPDETGFSFGDTTVVTTDQSTQKLYSFLQRFFERFPEYSKLDFHIFGESYGGRYVPSLAKLIDGNNANNPPINLKSAGIGNAWTEPKSIFPSYPDFIESNTYGPILSPDDLAAMRADMPKCYQSLDTCYSTGADPDCGTAKTVCMNITYTYFDKSGKSPFDIRTAEGYPQDYVTYLNKPDVIQAIGAQKTTFANCSIDVNNRFQDDYVRSSKSDVEYLLNKGYPVLFYTGDADFICNWFSGQTLVNSLNWAHQAEFNNAPTKQWVVNNVPAGEVKSFDNLTFLKIFGAGHEVPYYVPANSLDMFTKWINGQPLATEPKRKKRMSRARGMAPKRLV